MRPTILVIAAILLFLPVVSAATTVNIKTIPAHDVYVTIIDSNDNYISSPKKYRADTYGKVEHLYEGTKYPFKVWVKVKWQDTSKFDEKFGPYNEGEEISIELLPEGYLDFSGETTPAAEETEEETTEEEEEVEEAEEETTPAVEETEETTSPEVGDGVITGSVIAESDSSNSGLLKTFYYVIGGILLIGIVAFFVITVVVRGRKGRASQYGMQPVKLSGSSPPSSYDPRTDHELDKIEKEIELVEKEISHYKRHNRIMDAEKRLVEKKRALDNVRRGEGQPQGQQDKSKFKRRFHR